MDCASVLVHGNWMLSCAAYPQSIGEQRGTGGIWIVEAIFYGYFALITWLRPIFLFPTTLAPGIDFWLLNRLELLGIALTILGLGWLLLHNTETLLQGIAGEE